MSPIIYPWKFGKTQITGSQNIVQTRQRHIDANTNANWIRTKNNVHITKKILC